MTRSRTRVVGRLAAYLCAAAFAFVVLPVAPAGAGPVVFANYNIYSPCGTDHDALSIGANADDYPDVDVSDWEYSLDSGATWNAYYPIEYATGAGSHPLFGGLSHYILTRGAPVVMFRATGSTGTVYTSSVAMPADAASCSENPDYTPILPMMGGDVTDVGGLENDSFVIPAGALPSTAFFNESIVVQRADGTWILWTPDVKMTLSDLGFTNASVPAGATLTVNVARAGGAATDRPGLNGAQYMNQAFNTPGADYLVDIRFGYGHIDFTNRMPSGMDDTATTQTGTAVDIDVLDNDPTKPLTVVSATDPTNGTAEIIDGKIRYTPATGFSGTDTFTYTAVDAEGLTVTQKVTVTVTVTPIGLDDEASTDAGEPVDIDVLDNDPTKRLTVVSVTDPTNGTVEIIDGKIRYTPAAGFSGTDTFTYTAVDAEGQTITQTVTVTVRPKADPPVTPPVDPAGPVNPTSPADAAGPIVAPAVASRGTAQAGQSSGSQVAGISSGRRLAMTGADVATLALGGAAITAAGALILVARRRRISTTA